MWLDLIHDKVTIDVMPVYKWHNLKKQLLHLVYIYRGCLREFSFRKLNIFAMS